MSRNDEPIVLERPCGTWEYHVGLLERDPEYRQRFVEGQAFINEYLDHNADAAYRTSPAIIPVVVHVVYNTAAQNLSDAAVQTQIDALNRDYRMANADISTVPPAFKSLAADSRIEFRLAVRDPNCQPTNGITRTQTSTTAFNIFGSDDVKASATGGADPWPADKYLNFWVCPAQTGQGGRGTFPGTPANIDGVIVNYQVFGPGGAPYHLGRISVHEVGHYLSLYHTFQGGCADNDQVTDTPPQQQANNTCQTFPHVTCNNGPNGDMFMNYMDYPADACVVMFTLGQAARMQAALAGPRASLLASDGIVPAPVPDVADLWAADTPLDTGVEPDPVGAPMWQSEDIWIRNQNDGVAIQDHQNPVFRPGGAPPNYVYVRVRNRSCGMAASGDLRLYWAKASSALSWPAPWDGSVTTPALMGGPIGTKPTGSVPGRGSTVIEFAWSPPDPTAYSMFGGDQNHFCLLARIETSAAAPYGMTFAETTDLYSNVRNNNNIVWKNVEIATGNRELPGYVTIGNPGKKMQNTVLGIAAPAGRPGRRTWERLEMTVGADLAAKLRKHAKPSAGAELGKDAVIMRDPKARIGPFPLEPGEYYTVAIRVAPTADAPQFGVQTVDLVQYERRGRKDVVVGGQRLVFKVTPKLVRDRSGLIGRWWHAHEEDDGELQSFRREGYEFPVSKGRWGFELRDDHTATVLDIAAADGVEPVDGYWWGGDDDRVHIGLADPGRGDLVIRLHGSEGERLRLTRGEAPSGH